jgi:RND family efflux transporter MFP subunit
MKSRARRRQAGRSACSAYLLAGLLGAAGWGLAACGTSEAGSPPVPAAVERAEQAPKVEAMQVAPRTLPLMVEATGRVEAWRQVVVHSEATGVVVDLQAVEGRRVEQGDFLLGLDERDAALDLAEMEAEWLRAQASYAVSYTQESAVEYDTAAASAARKVAESAAKKAESGDPGAAPKTRITVGELDRQLAEGLISRQEYLRKKRDLEASGLLEGGQQNEVRAATTGVLQAEQRLARARLALEKKRLHAPLGGLVADLEVALGQRINTGEALLTLIEDGRLKVEVDVLEADIVRSRVGARAEVRIPAADMRLLGEVYSINPKIDPATGTGRVTVAIDNPGGALYAGLFANVAIELESLRERLAVPATAILQRQGRSLVFRIEGDRALWAWVEVGARSGDWVEIRSGLTAGDWVATGNHFALGHETRVEKVAASATR